MSVNGESEYTPSPRPHPRLRPEAKAFAEKNRGNMEKWFDYSSNIASYSSPRPVERLRSETARQVAQTNKGVMSEFMEGYPAPPLQRTVHPRGVKPEAQVIAEAHKGNHMREVMDSSGTVDVNSLSQPKIKGDEAQYNLDRNKGQVDHIMNDYGHLTPEAQPRPKVSYGGNQVLENHQGKEMGPLLRMETSVSPHETKLGRLHKESDGASWDETPPHIRTRPEAEDIVSRCKASSMGEIMKVDSKPPVYKEPKLLKHMMESGNQNSKTSPARLRPEGMQHYQRNTQCEMAAVLRGEPLFKNSPRRVNKMLERSEEW